MAATRVKDNEWIRQSFMLPKGFITDVDNVRRTLSDARFKFTDTTLGGNFAINPPPQFTRNADIKVLGKFSKSRGMGRYYSEAIDNNAVHIHMRFGVPKFNSLTQFFFNYYNPEAGVLANTGRGRGALFQIGKIVGQVVALPFQPLILANTMVNFMMQKPVSKYYYLKPTMPLYWNAVQTIINALAANMGMAPRPLSDEEKKVYTDVEDFNTDQLSKYREKLGASFNIWTRSGSIDIYKVATRAQRLANAQREEVARIMEIAESEGDLSRRLMDFYQEEKKIIPSNGYSDFESYRTAYFELGTNWSDSDEDGSAKMERTGYTWIEDSVRGVTEKLTGMAQEFSSYSWAEFQDGSQFVTFKVDNPGAVSESFSNSVKESELAGAMNGLSKTARTARFNLMDGNTGIAPLDMITDAVSNLLGGVAEGLKIEGLIGLAGNTFVDIPKTWDGSTANLPRADYTIELRSPYGNKMSRFQNLYVPLAMLLAAALPRSTGKQSYTSPFICELYSKGRNQIRLGMVESLSITRGTGNVGWTQNGEPLGIDISFSVVDMSTVLHMPITAGFSMDDFTSTGVAVAAVATGGAGAVAAGLSSLANKLTKGLFDDDNAFTDYMAVLGGLSLTDQVYFSKKLKINTARRLTDFQTWTSPAHFSNWLHGTTPARILSGIAVGTSRE